MNRSAFSKMCMWKTSYGYLAQNTAQISRNALASGLCDDSNNRGLAPNAIYLGRFEDFNRFRHAFCAPALARDLLAHFGFLGTAKMEHGWHDRTTTFNEVQ